MTEIIPMPKMITKSCANDKCPKPVHCSENSKQQFCSRYCEYSWIKKHGDKDQWKIKRLEASRCLTVPKDENVNLRKHKGDQ